MTCHMKWDIKPQMVTPSASWKMSKVHHGSSIMTNILSLPLRWRGAFTMHGCMHFMSKMYQLILEELTPQGSESEELLQVDCLASTLHQANKTPLGGSQGSYVIS